MFTIIRGCGYFHHGHIDNVKKKIITVIGSQGALLSSIGSRISLLTFAKEC